VADLYVFIYDATVEDPGDTAHGRAGLYFGENGELSSYEHAMAISQALVDTKLVKEGTAEPTTFSKEEMALYFRVRLAISVYGSHYKYDIGCGFDG
jgi:hypothetical protein